MPFQDITNGAERTSRQIVDDTIEEWHTCIACGDPAELRDCHNRPVCWACEEAV
jgi:hypothetical protein